MNANLAIGTEVAIGSFNSSFYGGWRYSFGWHVVRITLTQFSVANDKGEIRRFMISGCEEVGKKDYRGMAPVAYFNVDELRKAEQTKAKEAAARDAVVAVGKLTQVWERAGKEDLLKKVAELEAAVAAARAAVEAI